MVTSSRALQAVKLPASITVKELAHQLKANPIEVIKQLMRRGIMANVNQTVDYATAAKVAASFGYDVIKDTSRETTSAKKFHFREKEGEVRQLRYPVVTVMGHVDHGKTTLLDVIRHTNVTASEAGSITQHIGAYQVKIDGRKITFIDTPGHEAFTAMRAHGAKVTDIAVVVVAADDGVMPQTIEAIDHAHAAGVPIVVALNKIDKPNANPERVKQQLAEYNILIEEWGGDTICVPLSAKKGEGVSELLDNILILADILELKADPSIPAAGTIIEANLDKKKGAVATVLVQNGTLKIGDIVVAGETWGKTKALFNDKGKRIKQAELSMPAEILGLKGVPRAGDPFKVITTEREARALAEKVHAQRHQMFSPSGGTFSLDKVSTQIHHGEVIELNIVLKADTQGSIEPIKKSLERLDVGNTRVNLIHIGSGSITESDVLLATTSKGIVVGFNTHPTPGAHRMAELNQVDIRYYDVIYELVGDIEKALSGMLEPTYKDVIDGYAEVRAIFPSGKRTKVVGIYITEGKISRNCGVRILRQNQIVHESGVSSLKRFKDDVAEVLAGFECGVGVTGFNDFHMGDIIEFHHMEKE